MGFIQNYHFNHPDGYIAVYTDEAVRKMSSRSAGRPFIRFNIIRKGDKDGKVVISNITASNLQKYQTLAELQGNKIYCSPSTLEKEEQNTEISIKSLREQTGLTQTEFGQFAFGISLSTIQNWEGGQRKCPDYVIKLIEYKLKKENIIPDTPFV